MENSALNIAHQQYRRAEAHLRYKRFDDAIDCHKNAAKKLGEAKNLTKVAKALESLQLQQDFHNSQEGIIRLKKVQFEAYKKAVENQRQKMINLGKQEGPNVNPRGSDNNQLQNVIIRTMEEQDSLMVILLKRTSGSDFDDDSPSTSQTTSETSRIIEGSKHPKHQHTVIEELNTINQQLRSFVMQLVTQLDAKTREADELRRRVQLLEAQSVSTVTRTHNTLHVITDSTGNSSPFVLSPCSELSPEVAESHVRVLPVLAPLEMPNFDYSVFSRQKSDDDIIND